MNTPPSPDTPTAPTSEARPRSVDDRPGRDRAVVLGGGGSTGNAWLIGVASGLAEAGLDVTDADRTIGTSAGATAAAQLIDADPMTLFESVLAEVTPEPRSAGPARAPSEHTSPGHSESGEGTPRRPGAAAVGRGLERMQALIAESTDLADFRRRRATELLGLSEGRTEAWSEQWRDTVSSRFSARTWPHRNILLTTVDARTGDPVVVDRRCGISLVDAVAASCSSGSAYPIDQRRFIDGGFRANAENADLAAGCSRVLVFSPLGGRSLHPKDWGTHLQTQVDQLRASGSLVDVLVPDPTSEHLFGVNAMTLSLRPAAAQVGFAQGQANAERLATLWG